MLQYRIRAELENQREKSGPSKPLKKLTSHHYFGDALLMGLVVSYEPDGQVASLAPTWEPEKYEEKARLFVFGVDSDLFNYTKFKHFTDKYKKLGNNEKTVRSSASVATLLMVNNLMKILLSTKCVNSENEDRKKDTFFGSLTLVTRLVQKLI